MKNMPLYLDRFGRTLHRMHFSNIDVLNTPGFELAVLKEVLWRAMYGPLSYVQFCALLCYLQLEEYISDGADHGSIMSALRKGYNIAMTASGAATALHEALLALEERTDLVAALAKLNLPHSSEEVLEPSLPHTPVDVGIDIDAMIDEQGRQELIKLLFPHNAAEVLSRLIEFDAVQAIDKAIVGALRSKKGPNTLDKSERVLIKKLFGIGSVRYDLHTVQLELGIEDLRQLMDMRDLILNKLQRAHLRAVILEHLGMAQTAAV